MLLRNLLLGINLLPKIWPFCSRGNYQSLHNLPQSVKTFLTDPRGDEDFPNYPRGDEEEEADLCREEVLQLLAVEDGPPSRAEVEGGCPRDQGQGEAALRRH